MQTQIFMVHKRHLGLRAPTVLAVGFALTILVGALVLMLPVSAADGQITPFLDALFTAASASCVTGLVTVSTAVHWSVFGKCVILLLIQIGGLGFMSVMTAIASFAPAANDHAARAHGDRARGLICRIRAAALSV